MNLGERVEALTEIVRQKEGDLANAMDRLEAAQKAFDAEVAEMKAKAPDGSYWKRQQEWHQ